MKFISEYGGTFEVDDSVIPSEASDYNWQKVYMVDDSITLKTMWVASVSKRGFPRGEYKYAGEKHYDHKPSDEELLFLLCQYDALSIGYVTVNESYTATASLEDL